MAADSYILNLVLKLNAESVIQDIQDVETAIGGLTKPMQTAMDPASTKLYSDSLKKISDDFTDLSLNAFSALQSVAKSMNESIRGPIDSASEVFKEFEKRLQKVRIPPPGDPVKTSQLLSLYDKLTRAVEEHNTGVGDGGKLTEDQINRLIVQRDRIQEAANLETAAVQRQLAMHDALIAGVISGEEDISALKTEQLDDMKLLTKQLENMLKLNTEMLAIDDKVTLFDEGQITDLKIKIDHMKAIANEAEIIKDSQGALPGIYKELIPRIDMFNAKMGLGLGLTTAMVVAFGELVSTSDKFRQTTSKAAGGMNALTKDVAALEFRLGMSTEAAEETVGALISVGASQDLINEVGESIGMLAEMTGASAEAAALMSKRMQELTGSAAAAKNTMNVMAGVTAKSGLQADDLNSVMSELNDSLFDVAAAYSPEGAKGYAEALTKIAGAAKIAGANVDLMVKKFGAVAKDPLNNIRLLRGDMQKFMDLIEKGEATKAYGLMGDQIEQVIAKTKTMGPIAAKYYAEAATGMPLDELKQMNDSLKQMKQMEGLTAISSLWSDSLGSVMKSLKTIFNVIFSLLKLPLLPILKVVSAALQGIAWVLVLITQGMTWVGNKISWVIEKLGPFGTLISWVFQAFLAYIGLAIIQIVIAKLGLIAYAKAAVGAIARTLLLGKSAIFTGTALSSMGNILKSPITALRKFGGAMRDVIKHQDGVRAGLKGLLSSLSKWKMPDAKKGLSGMLGGLTKTGNAAGASADQLSKLGDTTKGLKGPMDATSKAVDKLGKGAGKASGSLPAMNKGLTGASKAGKATGSAVGPMLAFAVVLLAIGAAAMMIAYALQIANGNILGFVAVALTMVVVAIILALVANALTAAYPAMLIFAVILLAVGVAAMLMGLGVKFAAEGLVLMAGVAPQIAALFITFITLAPSAAVGFLMFAGSVAIGAFMLAAAMIPLAIATFGLILFTWVLGKLSEAAAGVGTQISLLAGGIKQIAVINVGDAKSQLKNLAEGISAVAGAVPSIFTLLGMVALAGVLNYLATSVANLVQSGSSLTQVGIGLATFADRIAAIDVESKMGKFVDDFESFADRIAEAALKIGASIALLNLLGPMSAIFTVREVPAETIPKIKPTAEEIAQRTKEDVKSREQLGILRGIAGTIKNISGSNYGPDIDEIRKLLAEHLPRISGKIEKEDNLSMQTDLNDWT